MLPVTAEVLVFSRATEHLLALEYLTKVDREMVRYYVNELQRVSTPPPGEA